MNQDDASREQRAQKFQYYRQRLEEWRDPFRAFFFESTPSREELDQHYFKFWRMGMMCCVDAMDFKAFEATLDRAYAEALKKLEDMRLLRLPSAKGFAHRFNWLLVYRLLYFFRNWLLALYGPVSVFLAFAVGSLMLRSDSPTRIPFSLVVYGAFIAAPLSLALLGKKSVMAVGSSVALLPLCVYWAADDFGLLRNHADFTSAGTSLVNPIAAYFGVLGALGFLRFRRASARWNEVERQLRTAAGMSPSFDRALTDLSSSRALSGGPRLPALPPRRRWWHVPTDEELLRLWLRGKYYLMATASLALLTLLASDLGPRYRSIARRELSAMLEQASRGGSKAGFEMGRVKGIQEGRDEANGQKERETDVRLQEVVTQRDEAKATVAELRQQVDRMASELNKKPAAPQVPSKPPTPESVQEANTCELCAETRLLANAGCDRITVEFPPGKGPKQVCPKHPYEMVVVDVCDASNMVASYACPHSTRRRFRKGYEPTIVCNIDHAIRHDGN